MQSSQRTLLSLPHPMTPTAVNRNGAGHTRPEVIFDRLSSYGHIMTIRDAVEALILTVELPIISAARRVGRTAGSCHRFPPAAPWCRLRRRPPPSPGPG